MKVVELAGGVGGAKLAEGLAAHLGADLTVIVNTGDDLELHGLAVWPDHDTVAYTLAGLDDEDRGWGLRDETWTVMDRLAALGDDPWFRLGDRDIATHVWRTDRLRDGARSTEVALALREAMGIAPTILPMADEPVRTQVRADEGWLEFQEYFVHRHQAPTVHEVRFAGIEGAVATPEVEAALAAADVDRHRAVQSDRLDRADPGRPRRDGGDRRGARTRHSRDRGQRRSSAGWRSRDPRIGCSLRSAMRRVRSAWPGSMRRSRRTWWSTRWTPTPLPRDRRARPSRGRVRHDHARRRRAFTGRPGHPRSRRQPRRVTDGPPTLFAIVPVGRLDGAKSRLGAALDAEERHDLVIAMAETTIRATVATPGITETLVMTPDDAARDLALAAGARPLRQRTQGLNEGLREARDEAIAAGATAILIVPIDLPRRSHQRRSQPIVGTLDHARRRRSWRSPPTAHGRGTNALLLAPPDVIDVHVRRRQPSRARGCRTRRRGPGPSSSTGRSRWTSTRRTTCCSASSTDRGPAGG